MELNYIMNIIELYCNIMYHNYI